MYLVIGARGQDGSLLFDRLNEERLPVIGLGKAGICEMANVPAEIREYIELRGDLLRNWVCSETILSEFMSTADIKVVFDCAASHTSTSQFSKRNQTDMYRLNVQRTTSILDALILTSAHKKPPRLITCGSSLMYSGKGGIRIDETTEMAPKTGYGYAKLIARKQCEVLRHFGIECSMAILFNHDSVRRPHNYFLPKAIKAVRLASQSGFFAQLGSLQKKIDIGSANDVVEALLQISRLERIDSDYVVATGVVKTLAEVVDYIGTRLGLNQASRVLGDSVGSESEIEDFVVGDITKIREEVGWEPQESIFEVIDAMIEKGINGD